MSEQHTKEPWHVFSLNRIIEVKNLNGNAIVHWTGFDATRVNEDAEANARRIVACVNACADFTTEWLERMTREQSIKKLIAEHADMMKQRDELLAALERLCLAKSEKDQHGDTPVYRSLKAGAWRAAESAISGAKGIATTNSDQISSKLVDNVKGGTE